MAIPARDFFTQQEQDAIRQVVMDAELDTSGEIRIHIENKCKGDVLDRASYVFKQLKMNETLLRNGVLVYLALDDHKFAIIGDKGINKVVPPNFWDDISQNMMTFFQKNEFKEGLCQAIAAVGHHLKKYFPYRSDDVNELADDLSFGNN